MLGFDEYAPGNKLKIENERKVMNVSFSFKEMGQSALCSEVSWFTFVAVRSKIVSTARGGWGSMLRLILRELLLGPLGFLTSGVPVMTGIETVMVFAQLTNVLSDGDGFRQAYDWRGHASMRPCLRHWNILKKDHWPALNTPSGWHR